MAIDGGTGTIKSVCFMCHNSCGIEAHLSHHKLVKVTPDRAHPFHHLCVKSRGMAEWLYSPDRILTPRQRVNGSWRQVSRDDALTVITDRLAAIREKYGARVTADILPGVVSIEHGWN